MAVAPAMACGPVGLTAGFIWLCEPRRELRRRLHDEQEVHVGVLDAAELCAHAEVRAGA